MEKSQVNRDYSQILEGTSRYEKLLILLLAAVLYVLHTRLFIFLFLALFTYPIAVFLFLKGAGVWIFVGTSVIHAAVFEATSIRWHERQYEVNYQKQAVKYILKKLKTT
jgi:heme O synthase-like polyprenyltransferase